jgi:hypothetical protein
MLARLSTKLGMDGDAVGLGSDEEDDKPSAPTTTSLLQDLSEVWHPTIDGEVLTEWMTSKLEASAQLG